jgi:hypothetical protein
LPCTTASVNDLDAFKQTWEDTIINRTIFSDKSYIDQEYFEMRFQMNDLNMQTNIKLVKGEKVAEQFAILRSDIGTAIKNGQNVLNAFSQIFICKLGRLISYNFYFNRDSHNYMINIVI